MATLPYLGQVPAQWFNLSGSAALSGGTLYFYEVGTSTPKAVYTDYQGLTAAGTSVTLDATGRANVFTNGLYRVILRDAVGVQIGPSVDGIGFPEGVDAGAARTVENYDDLRAFTGADGTVFVVEGRTANGDGGAGLFVWDALETATDDDGTILTPGTNPASGRWIRIFSGDMDLRWFGGVLDNATDDTASYASGLAASVGRKRWLGIFGGTARLASTVSAPSGAMVRFTRGGALTASSGAVSAGFPSGSTLEGAYRCFKGSLVVSIAQEASWQVDPDWWDSVDDDTRILAATTACASANQQVLIRHAYAMTSSFTQPTNPVLVFEGSGRLSWSGAGAVNIVLRRFTSGEPGGGRFFFSSVAKLASLAMVDNQDDYLSPLLFGANGGGIADDSRAVWPVILHGKGRIDSRILVNVTLAKTGSIDLRGPIADGTSYTDSNDVPAALILGSGIDLTATEGITLVGVGIIAKNAAQSSVTATGSAILRDAVLWGQENAGVASLGFEAASIAADQVLAVVAPMHGANSMIRDSIIEGSGTYSVAGVDQVGLGGDSWTIDRTTIEEANRIGIQAIRDSSIVADVVTWAASAESISSTVTPLLSTSRGATSGILFIRGGAFSLSVDSRSGDGVFVSDLPSNVQFPWNGYGIMDISNARNVPHNAGSTGDAVRRCVSTIDGVRSAEGQNSNLGAVQTTTSATTNWTFAPSGTPSVVSDAFSWGAGSLAATPATIDKAIVSNDEKSLAAYGGYVIVEFTGGITSIRLLIGAEDSTITAAPSTQGQKAVFHVWPGVFAATTSYSLRVGHNGQAGTVKVTILPCAPVDARQWWTFWGGDRTLSASRYNTWKAGLDEGGACKSLDLWCESLPVFPFTPRPETIQPWMTVLTPQVRVFPKNQAHTGGIVANPLFSSKLSGGAGFRTYLCGEG